MDHTVQIVYLAARFVIAFFVGSIAKDKGRSFGLWFVFGVIAPVFAPFYVMLVDDLRWPVFPWQWKTAKWRSAALGRDIPRR